MYTHTCKCGSQYESDDPDAYLCASCITDRKRIAAELDAKFANIPREPIVTGLQRYDQAEKVRGFVRASDLL